MEEVYCVIDLKSFYASCECAARGLDIFSTPLVVADPDRSVNTIVMSAAPYLKEKYGVPNVCRVRDLPDIPHLILARPRMAYYIEMSAKVISIFLDFVDEEDLHVYSIDESFLRLTPYLKMHGTTPEGLVEKIQNRIKDELGLVATAGIAPNMFLAKICLDNEGKKVPPYRGHWGYEDVPTKLWSIRPITKIWGISSGIERRLSKLGIRSLEALAKSNREVLKKEFGIMGCQLHDLANGIDRTDIRDKYIPKEPSLSQGHTIIGKVEPYRGPLIIGELVEDLCFRLRQQRSKTKLVSVTAIYKAESGGVPFSRQCSLDIATDDVGALKDACLALFHRYHSQGEPLQGLSVSFGKLSSYDGTQQLSLFEDEAVVAKRHELALAMDAIGLRYGRNAILHASALTEGSTIKERHTQIGGHKA